MKNSMVIQKLDDSRNLMEFFNVEGNISDDVAILQKFQSELWLRTTSVYFLIRIPIRCKFVISMSADSMYF